MGHTENRHWKAMSAIMIIFFSLLGGWFIYAFCIKGESSREGVFFAWANDYSLQDCRQQADQGKKDECLFQYLDQNHDPSKAYLCVDIQNGFLRRYCNYIYESDILGTSAGWYVWSYMILSLLGALAFLYTVLTVCWRYTKNTGSLRGGAFIGLLSGILIYVWSGVAPLFPIFYHAQLLIRLACPPNGDLCATTGGWLGSFPTPWGLFVATVFIPAIYVFLGTVASAIYIRFGDVMHEQGEADPSRVPRLSRIIILLAFLIFVMIPIMLFGICPRIMASQHQVLSDAIASGRVEQCAHIYPSSLRDQCVEYMAQKLRDISICDSSTNTKARSHCIDVLQNDQAIENNSRETCEQISDEGLKNSCLATVHGDTVEDLLKQLDRYTFSINGQEARFQYSPPGYRHGDWWAPAIEKGDISGTGVEGIVFVGRHIEQPVNTDYVIVRSDDGRITDSIVLGKDLSGPFGITINAGEFTVSSSQGQRTYRLVNDKLVPIIDHN